MQQILRQENKYLLTLLESQKFINHLNKVLIPDDHNGAGGYLIRSLYFDTMYDKDFTEKEDGVEVRKKIRLRLYDPADNFALLEMKQKQGDEQKKRSLKLSQEDAEMLCKGNYSVLLKYSEPFAVECYTLMNMQFYRPKAIVEYNRYAFVARENKIRITFDSNIKATESCFDIFSQSLSLSPVLDVSHVVFEVKYNNFLPSYIKDLISEVNRSKLSVSKYCLSRSVSQKYIF